MDALLKGLQWSHDNHKLQGDIRIRKGLIIEIGQHLVSQKRERVIQFNNHSIYPGLINAHDHLEMNLYPRMGNPPYNNYSEWGNDIYKPRQSPIKEIEKISLKDRLLWGGIKNTLSGVTTVVHHNPWQRFLSTEKFPVKVLKHYTWSHSLAFGKHLEKSFTLNSKIPFIIHAAEGVDELALEEIGKLKELGLLKHNTVLIHAIALRDSDIATIAAVNASVVWCPVSNLFLFNQTAPIQKLKSNVKTALGTDSTLTGSPTLLDEMKSASQTGLVVAQEIFNQVTSIPAQIFNLPTPVIEINAPADLLILPSNNSNYFENLIESTSAQIELVMVNGEPRFGSELAARELGLKKYFGQVNGVRKWFYNDVAKLKKQIEKKAGKSVAQNPLWQMIG